MTSPNTCMSQDLFKVGGVYRDAAGRVQRLSATYSRGDPCPAGTAWSQVLARDRWCGDGTRTLATGLDEDCFRLGCGNFRHLIPGELTLVNGEWISFAATLDREPEKVEPKFGPFPFYDRMSDALGLPRMTTAGGWELFGRALTPRSVPRCMRNGEFMWGIEATYVGAAPSKTPALDELENTTEPIRPPLDWAAAKVFDKFDGFVVTSNTSPDTPSKNTGFPAWRADTAATHRLGAGVKS